MNIEAPSTLKGHFLMAMPALADPNFRRSVTCISEHTPEGAVGIVVNQIHPQLNGRMIFEELGIPCGFHADDIAIHVGGPVHSSELFILHADPLEWESSLLIKEGLALSNSRDILEAIAKGSGPAHALVILGCAGWGAGQLEWEMMQNAWLTLPCDSDVVFQIPVEQRWEYAIKQLGVDPDLLSDRAGNA